MTNKTFKTVSLHKRVHDGLSEVAAFDGRTLAGTVGVFVQGRLVEINSKTDLVGITVQANLVAADPVIVLSADELPLTVLDLDEAELLADVLAAGAVTPKSMTTRHASRLLRIARDGRHSIEIAVDGRTTSMSHEIAEILAGIVRQRVVQANDLVGRAAA